MAVQGFGPADFAKLAQLAWRVYANVRDSRSNFGRLHLDAESLLVSIGSLDKGHTQQLIEDYISLDDDVGGTAGGGGNVVVIGGGGGGGGRRATEVRALRDGLNSVIMPFYALFEDNRPTFGSSKGGFEPLDKNGVDQYVVGASTAYSTRPQRPDRPWRRWPVHSWAKRLEISFELKELNELRSRFAVQAANLNLFLTRLTHSQLQRQTELLTLRMTEQTLLDRNWLYSRDLERGSRRFREDVARYIEYLLSGGDALSEDELRIRKTGKSPLSSPSVRIADPIIRPLTRTSSRERQRPILKQTTSESYRDQSFGKVRWPPESSSSTTNVRQQQEMDEELLDLDEDAEEKLEEARKRLAIAEAQGLLESDTDNNNTTTTTSSSGKGSGNNIRLEETPISPSDRKHPFSTLPPNFAFRPPPSSGTSAQYHRQQTYSPASSSPSPRADSDVTAVDSSLSTTDSIFNCDRCAAPIPLNTSFHRCSSGKCGKNGDTYDLCRRCYKDKHRCKGYTKGKCGKMSEVKVLPPPPSSAASNGMDERDTNKKRNNNGENYPGFRRGTLFGGGEFRFE